MGGEQRNSVENSSLINAGWQYCNLCDGIESQMRTLTTTISIKTAPATVVVWMVNGTVADIEVLERTPYVLNVSELFKAFSAPLWINQTKQWENEGVAYVRNVTNTTLLAEDFVDSTGDTLLYGKFSPKLLRVFLTFALYNNRRNGPIVSQGFFMARQANSLTISRVSVVGFTEVTAIILICSLIMWGMFPRTRRPNISSYPEVMFGEKLTIEMRTTLSGLSNGADKRIIEKLVDVKIKAGASEDGMRIVITTLDVTSLKRGVKYT